MGKVAMKKVTVLAAMTVVLGSFLVGRPERGVYAATSPSKMSKDLEDKVKSGGSVRIPVIILTPSAPTNSLSTAVTGAGGVVKRKFSKVLGIVAELPPGAVASIAKRTDVTYVALDRAARVTGHVETTTGALGARGLGTSTTGTLDGRGVGIAVLDSGVDTTHHGFNSGRVVASVDFTGTGVTTDVYGHGTHVAALAAANDHVSIGAYTGVAPAANVINVRVLDANGAGSASNVIAGIEWCIANKSAYNIRVINLSLGTTAVDSYANDPLCLAARRAFDAGIVVVAAAGNSGKDEAGQKIYGAIHSPGIEPSVRDGRALGRRGDDLQFARPDARLLH
jgi:serine protease AprX